MGKEIWTWKSSPEPTQLYPPQDSWTDNPKKRTCPNILKKNTDKKLVPCEHGVSSLSSFQVLKEDEHGPWEGFSRANAPKTHHQILPVTSSPRKRGLLALVVSEVLAETSPDPMFPMSASSQQPAQSSPWPQGKTLAP